VNSHWHKQRNITEQQRSQLFSQTAWLTGTLWCLFYKCCLPLVAAKIFWSQCGFTSSLLPYTLRHIYHLSFGWYV
jgi:hypothetical protein